MSIFDTIKTDVGEAWNWIEGEAVVAWDLFKSVVTTFTGAEITKLTGFVGTAITDVEQGDYEGLATAVLNLAVGAGETFLQDVEGGVLEPVLAAIAKKLGW